MKSYSNKEDSVTYSYPRSLLSITTSVCGLAIFLIMASILLVSQPIGSTVRGYFYGVDHVDRTNIVYLSNITIHSPIKDRGNVEQSDPRKTAVDENEISPNHNDSEANVIVESQYVAIPQDDIGEKTIGKERSSRVQDTDDLSVSHEKEGNISSPGSLVEAETKEPMHQHGQRPSENATPSSVTEGLSNSSSITQTDLVVAGCDLYHGKWVYDSAGPLYTNNSCPVLSQMQNCQGNGRPDRDYENWRWKPSECELPRFDAKKFLELMRGKTLAFIGDSVARNQMESLLCILWQVEVPKNRGNKKMQRYYFRSTSTMIIRIWSSWLVHQTSEPVENVPANIVKLHLDKPDEGFMEHIRTFDVMVLSSGHWFAKQSVYMLNNEIVGGQLWRPEKSRPMKINNVEAFGISVETILSSIATHPDYTGLTIVRSFSPDHYEGGAWNTGGSCTGKEKPILDGKLVENGFTNIMHKKQGEGFDRAIKKMENKSKLKLMDITEAFGYRHDGHPGPYRSPDPNKITKRGPDGRPPPQDCLHWCMPGPVDTWNELVMEIIRREFEGSHNSNA